MQFSMELKPVEEIEMLKAVPELIFPMFWIEEGVSLGKDITNQLKYTLYL